MTDETSPAPAERADRAERAAHPARRPWRRPMVARDRDEVHRSATPLELLFDLCFVVAVAHAATRLHHGVAEANVGEATLGYLMVFFAIWWAGSTSPGSPRPTTPTTCRTGC